MVYPAFSSKLISIRYPWKFKSINIDRYDGKKDPN
jgi:hypothetical protein